MIKWSFYFHCRTVRFKDLCFSHLSEFLGWSSGVTSPFTLSFITYFGVSLITYLSVINHIFESFEHILGYHIFPRIFLSSSTCVTSSFALSCIHFFRIDSTCITPRYFPVIATKNCMFDRGLVVSGCTWCGHSCSGQTLIILFLFTDEDPTS